MSNKGDFTDCPPVMVQVGGDELLLSDARSLRTAFERDGVVHEYKEWEELWHVFQMRAHYQNLLNHLRCLEYF